MHSIKKKPQYVHNDKFWSSYYCLKEWLELSKFHRSANSMLKDCQEKAGGRLKNETEYAM